MYSVLRFESFAGSPHMRFGCHGVDFIGKVEAVKLRNLRTIRVPNTALGTASFLWPRAIAFFSVARHLVNQHPGSVRVAL